MTETANLKSLSICEAADHVEKAITEELVISERALVVWSGGSSPKRLVPELSKRKVEWRRVAFLLSDERCVPEQSAKSNRGEMIRYLAGTPLQAAALERLPISRERIQSAESQVDAILKYTACVSVLGVGGDGHIASLFPRSAWSVQAPVGPLVYDQYGAGDCARVSLSPTALWRSKKWLVFVNTPQKRTQWSRAAAGTDPREIPCAIAFAQSAPPVHVIDEESEWS